MTKRILQTTLALALAGAATQSSAAITPVVAWDFNEGSGTTTTSLDQSYGWNGNTQSTVSLTQYTSNAFSASQWNIDGGIAPGSTSSISFSNSTLGDEITSNYTGAGITGTGSKTFVAWIAPSADNGFFMLYHPNDNAGEALRFGMSGDNGIRGEISGGGFETIDNWGGSGLAYDTWVMVAAVYETGNNKLFIGSGGTISEVSSYNQTTGTTINTATGGNLVFGEDQGFDGDRDFAGLLAAAAVYSGSATQTELQNIYDTGVTVVPEPSTYALLAGFLALGLVMIRRRQS